jgi:multidrug efflux system membrane fusion protein
MRFPPKFAAVASIGALAFVFVAFMALAGCKSEAGGGDDDDNATLPGAQKGTAQISVVNGETVLTLDAATQTRIGLTTAPLGQTTSRAQQSLPAVVLSPVDLATSRGSLLSAQAQLQKARVEEDVANKEYTRLQTLYANDQNVSQKSLEAAQGTAQADQTDVAVAEQQVSLQKSLVGQQWGATVADWAQQDTPTFERLLNQTDALVQVTVPADSSLAAPKSLYVQSADGSKTEATLVSSFPRVDPRVQGRSFLYVMSPRAPIAPETTLLAYVSVGSQMKGVVVPSSAVVWSEGTAWVYQQTGPGQFTRRQVPADFPLENGIFVAKGLPIEDNVVTVGAQALLSEEFLLRGASAGTNDD